MSTLANQFVNESKTTGPYVGPQPFQRWDSGRFFGRDQEINELLSLVIAHRAAVLYAPSGAGKTSLLNAGLIPKLEEKGFEVLPPTRVLGPAESVTQNIANIYTFQALARLEGEESATQNLAQLTIAEYLKQQGNFLDKYGLAAPRVLIFDQFEEFFTAYPARWQEREAFFEQLQEALESEPLLRIIFSLREDYLAQLEPYAPTMPDKLRHRFRLERMTPKAALDAVCGPLQDTDRIFTDQAADKLISELRKIQVESANGTVTAIGKYIEPVQLQVVCQNLWQSLPREVKTITEKELADYGDVTGALSQYYEKAIKETVNQSNIHVKENDLRNWFEKQLITPARTRSLVFQDKETDLTGGIPNPAIQFLDREHHIIRGEFRSGSRWYELTHDRFIDPILKANQKKREAVRRNRLRIAFALMGSLAIIVICFLVGLITVQYAGSLSAQADATAEAATQSLEEFMTQIAVADMEETATLEYATTIAQQATAIAQQATATAQQATATAQQAAATAQQATVSAQQATMSAQQATSSAERVTISAQQATATAVARSNEVLATAIGSDQAQNSPELYLAWAETRFPKMNSFERAQSLVTLIGYEDEIYLRRALELFYGLEAAEQQELFRNAANINPSGLAVLVDNLLQTWWELTESTDNNTLETVETALQINPADNLTGELLVLLRFYKVAREDEAAGQYESAVSTYNNLLELEPENTIFLLERGLAYAEMGNPRAAVADYEMVINLIKEDDSLESPPVWETGIKNVIASALCNNQRTYELLQSDPFTYFDSFLTHVPQTCITWMEAWPTEFKQINQTFGANSEFYAQFGLPGHEGVDIQAPQGSSIFSVADGVVERIREASDGNIYGNAVYIRHENGYRTLYAQLQEVLVEVGDSVTAGQIIGLAGNSGNSFGAHLHFGLFHDGATASGETIYPADIIDPTPFLIPLLNEITRTNLDS